MGGQISLASEVGKGSAFSFSVTFKKAPARQTPTLPAPSTEPLRQVRVLIVDDNSANRTILLNMTAQWGMRTECAPGGAAALESLAAARAAGDPFRVLLLDGTMPEMDGFAVAQTIQSDPRPGKPLMLMLTSAGRPGEGARCRELGIAAYLLKPVLRADLLQALLSVLHNGGEPTEPPPLITRHSLRENLRPLHILVAEDNPINQLLISRMLGKRGHRCVLAENGNQAVRRSEQESYDLIFMDVQMPEMDGLAATAAIRARELKTGLHIPIYAMTAHAMKGDQETCLRAGMDGYLSKPLASQLLDQVLLQVAQSETHLRAGGSALTRQAPDAGSCAMTWSREATLARLGGDETLLREFCQLFLDEQAHAMDCLRRSLATADSDRLMRAAHNLRGQLGYLGAHHLVQLATALEDVGRTKALSRAHSIFIELESQINALCQSMRLAKGANS